MSQTVPPVLAPPVAPVAPVAPERSTADAESALRQLIVDGFARTNARFDRTDANLALVSSDLGEVKGRVVQLENWRNGNSDRVKAAVSESNLEHQAELAKEIEARQALATEVQAIKSQGAAQLVLLGEIKVFTENPVVRRIASQVATLVIGWLTAYAALKGWK